MIKTAIASTALFAASALASGAVVVNSCSYDVQLANTPSAGGGYSTISQTLSSGGSYSQQWTQLSNGNGWSIKLSKDSSFNNIMQYEYTFHDDGTIWYDLSDVNGNPWDGNWEITASSGCNPKQQAYRYSTDDAYGMQACPQDSTITVTLCSGDSGAGSASPAASSAAPETSAYGAATSPATSVASAPATTAAASPATSAAPSPSQHHWTPLAKVVNDKKKAKASPTTLVTSALTTYTGPATTVTNVHMETVTQYVTATAAAKRHEHHPRHPHHRH